MVWHSGLTDKNKRNLERVQKSALKIILKEKYIDYKNALSVMKMDSLEVRREKLCLNPLMPVVPVRITIFSMFYNL